MLKNYSKKAILFFICLALLSGLGFIYKDKAIYYFKTKQFAKAAGGLPWQFSGVITYYQPVCASDPVSGVCANCPMCTLPPAGNSGGVGNYNCNGYQEILDPLQFEIKRPGKCLREIHVSYLFSLLQAGERPF